MSAPLRVIDSGLRGARRNLSVTEALARGARAGTTPDTLRFQHFPPSAIIGRHQILAREVDLDWVGRNGVATARRMTGGGAIVMGPGILGWELVVARRLLPVGLGEIARTICAGAATGLSTLGVAAAFRPRNDIEVDGRKIGGTGGYFDGDHLVFQGTALVALDRRLLLNALRLPAHKLGRHGVETLAQRITDLASLLGSPPSMTAVQAALAAGVAGALGMAARPSGLSSDEEAAADAIHDAEIGNDAFVTGQDDRFGQEGVTLAGRHAAPGGLIEVALKLRDGAAEIIDQAMIAGDFFAARPRVIADLEAHLRHLPVAAAADAARRFLAENDAGFLGLANEDVLRAIDIATAGDRR